jgi:hypothetical protein
VRTSHYVHTSSLCGLLERELLLYFTEFLFLLSFSLLFSFQPLSLRFFGSVCAKLSILSVEFEPEYWGQDSSDLQTNSNCLHHKLILVVVLVPTSWAKLLQKPNATLVQVTSYSFAIAFLCCLIFSFKFVLL